LNSKTFTLIAIFVLIAGLGNGVTAQERSRTQEKQAWEIDRPEPKKYLVNTMQLREVGLVVQIEATDFAFPNRCYDKLTISDAFLARYKRKGFSLETLCIGMLAPVMYYHPETGAPLTNVVLDLTRQNFLIEVPDCFRNGTPYHDCLRRFDVTVRKPEVPKDPKNPNDWTKSPACCNPWTIDETMSQLRATGRFGGPCQCEDLEAIMCVPRSPYRQCGGSLGPNFSVKAGVYCYIDKVPTCAQQMAEGRVRAGSLHFELSGNFLREHVGRRETGFVNEPIDISPTLPRGFAYRWIGPEGDDPTPYAQLRPGQRISVGE
jgi:hypothetical protein